MTANAPSTRLKLLAPFPPEECAARLAAAINQEPSAFLAAPGGRGSHPVVGRISASGLRLRKLIAYRNSFQSFLSATMQAARAGTLIAGQVAMHPFVRFFLIVWFSGVVIIGGTMFLAATSVLLFGSGSQLQSAWLGALVPPAMLAFGFGLLRFGRHLASGETAFLREFLMQTLNASQAEPGMAHR